MLSDRPVFSRAVFLAMLGWCVLLPLPLQQSALFLTNCSFFAAAVALAFLERRQLATMFSYKDAAVVLFLSGLAAGAGSMLFPRESRLMYVSLLGTFAPFFVIARIASYGQRRQLWAGRAMCLCAAGVALLALAEVLCRYNPLYTLVANEYYQRYILQTPPRPCVTLYNPAVVGSFLAAGLPFCFCIGRRWFRRVAVTLVAAAVVLTFSRGAFIAMVTVCAVYAAFSMSRRYRLLLAAAIVLVVGLSTLLQGNPGRFGFSEMVWGSGDSIVSSYRLDRLRAGFEMARDFPLRGVGWGNYRRVFPVYNKDAAAAGEEFRVADNMYVTVLAESGPAGFAGLILLLLAAASNSAAAARQDSRAGCGCAVFACLCGLAVNMASYELFFWPGMLGIFAMVCAMALSPRGERL